MPPPGKPCSFGTAGLSADEIADIDPDYLYFLRHLRPEGRAYAVEIPSKDGSSRPQVVRYEEPLAAPNAQPPAASSDGGTQGTPSPKEEDSSAAVEVPSGAASPPAGPDGEARGGAVPVERDGLLSSKVEPAWYDSVSNIDEDYRFFLQHSRVVNDSQWVLEIGNFFTTFGEAPSVRNCEDDDEDEEEDGVEEVKVVSASGGNSVGADEENNVQEEKQAVVRSKWPIVKVWEIDTKVKEVVSAVKNGEDEKDSDKNEGMDNDGSDLQLVNVMGLEDFEMDMEEEEEQPLNVPITRTPESEPSNREASSRQGHSAMPHNASKVDGEVDKEVQPLNVHVMRTPESEPSNGETSSRQGHSAMPRNALELEGVIWPTHILERPESDFKRKLMKVLIKPFNREEYDKLFAMATYCTPVIKERRTRRRVMYYPWKHKMGKSYFDNYPDLADQVEGENSYPNRLALLRGFFFWMENVGHDEQFRPWRDDHKSYRVFYSTES